MVGLVVVSHSNDLANSLVQLAKQMAPNANVVPAGGTNDNSFGTSYEKIKEAVLNVYSEDGVLILCDMGSSVMTAEMVLEELDKPNIKICDCPLCEGTIKAAVDSLNYKTLKEVEPTWENSILHK